MTITHQRNYLTEEASITGDTLAETRAIAILGGGEFHGSGALDAARERAALAAEWMVRHPEASATSRSQNIGARPLNRLAQALLRRGAHISDVRHMVTH